MSEQHTPIPINVQTFSDEFLQKHIAHSHKHDDWDHEADWIIAGEAVRRGLLMPRAEHDAALDERDRQVARLQVVARCARSFAMYPSERIQLSLDVLQPGDLDPSTPPPAVTDDDVGLIVPPEDRVSTIKVNIVSESIATPHPGPAATDHPFAHVCPWHAFGCGQGGDFCALCEQARAGGVKDPPGVECAFCGGEMIRTGPDAQYDWTCPACVAERAATDPAREPAGRRVGEE